MGHHEKKERTAEEAAKQRLEDKHPARPEQVDTGFQVGYDQERDTPEERLGPNYARGIADENEAETERSGRFSRGHEEQPEDTPEKVVERRFSEGVERDSTSK